MTTLALLSFLLMVRSLLSRGVYEPYAPYQLDDLAVPANFYDAIKAKPNMYFDELKKDEFEQIFLPHVKQISNLDSYLLVPFDMVLPEDQKYVQQSTQEYILNILNMAVSKESKYQFQHPFQVVSSVMKSMYIGKNGRLASVQVLVHRPTKMYGMLATYHVHINQEKHISLIKADIHGFVFEDRIYGNIVPASLPVHTGTSYVDMVQHTILKSQEWEQKELCKQVQKHKEQDGVNYASLGLNTLCEAKSSSNSS